MSTQKTYLSKAWDQVCYDDNKMQANYKNLGREARRTAVQFMAAMLAESRWNDLIDRSIDEMAQEPGWGRKRVLRAIDKAMGEGWVRAIRRDSFLKSVAGIKGANRRKLRRLIAE
jgi:hypothetical protein